MGKGCPDATNHRDFLAHAATHDDDTVNVDLDTAAKWISPRPPPKHDPLLLPQGLLDENSSRARVLASLYPRLLRRSGAA